jgi:hypothetical protein
MKNLRIYPRIFSLIRALNCWLVIGLCGGVLNAEAVELIEGRPQRLALTAGEMEEWAVSGGTRLIRQTMTVGGGIEGDAVVIEWGSIRIGVRHQPGRAQLLIAKPGGSWQETGYAVSTAGDGEEIALELGRFEVGDHLHELVFVEGRLLARAGQQSGKPADGYRVRGNGQSRLVLDAPRPLNHIPHYVVRTLRRLGHSLAELESEGWRGDHRGIAAPQVRLQMPGDEARRTRGGGARIEEALHVGDLTWDEEAWYLTQTVNRSWYDRVAVADLGQLPLMEATLVQRGADYLPTLESRAWVEPWHYTGYGESYIEKIYGYLMADEAGDYSFYLSGDERAVLMMEHTAGNGAMAVVAELGGPTGRHAWSGNRIGSLRLEPWQAVYFELWHEEITGDDHVAVGWSRDGGPIEVIPGAVVSSHSGGRPGTWPRSFLVTDPQTLAEVPMADAERSVPLALTGPWAHIDGTLPLLQQDFPSAGGSRFHAHEAQGGGLGWLWSSATNWPSLNAQSAGGLGWLWYTAASANPQEFYDYSSGAWLWYHHAPHPYINYAGIALPVLWDFESGLTQWDQVAAPDDTHDWVVWSGSTPSAQTGPQADHSLGSASGQYVYLETSHPHAYVSGNVAMLVSPYIHILPGATMLHVHYHMFGSQTGALHVDIWRAGVWTNSVWTRSGQQQTSSGESYRRADIPLPATPAERLIRVRIRAVAAGGYMGDIAIDDVAMYILGSDMDSDGLSDGDELLVYRTDPWAYDTDGDGRSDGEEVLLYHSDPLDGYNRLTQSADAVLILF